VHPQRADHRGDQLGTVLCPRARSLAELQRRIRDPNWRIFAEDGLIYALNNRKFLTGSDPFELFAAMEVDDPEHAFYLGYELMKATTALTLHKSYRQDQALQWGLLTRPEQSHPPRHDRHRREGPTENASASGPEQGNSEGPSAAGETAQDVESQP
jgi:hypothetical protein